MPAAATVPNSTIPAPPSTGYGTAAITRPTTGNSPSTSRIAPPAVTPNRDRTPLLATRPTFWARADCGNELNTGATADESMSARSPSAIRRESTLVPITSPTAMMSAVVSVDHEDHDEHRDDRGDAEGRRAEVERRRQCDDRAGAHRGEVRHPQRGRDRGAHDDREEDREPGEEPDADLREHDDDQQRERGQPDVCGLPEGGVVELLVAAGPARRDREQAEPDRRDDDAGDDRREEPHDAGEERRDEQAEHGGADHRAEDGREPAAGGDRAHRRDARERDPLHER